MLSLGSWVHRARRTIRTDPWLLRLLQDRREPLLRTAFLRAIRQTRDAVHGHEIEPRLVMHFAQPTGAQVAATFQAAGERSAAELQALIGSGRKAVAEAEIAFDMTNPAAVAWAKAHSAELVTLISSDVQAAIKLIISSGLAEGLTPADMARLIRLTIGLTPVQAGALAKYESKLAAEGRAAAEVARLGEKYAAKLLNYRATLIARTETIRASVAGQRELWNQAVTAGYLNPAKTKRVWSAAPDACFTADSLVVTSNGPRPIGDIRVGDKVLGPSGQLRRVLAIGRRIFTGRMVVGPGFSCTPDHRLLSVSGLWRPAREYFGDATGDILVDSRFTKAKNSPAALFQVARLSFVFRHRFWKAMSVPVIPVAKDDDTPGFDREICRPSPVDRDLFLKRASGFQQRRSHRAFNSGWSNSSRNALIRALQRAIVWASWSDAALIFLKSLAASAACYRNFRLPIHVGAATPFASFADLTTSEGTILGPTGQLFSPFRIEQAHANRTSLPYGSGDIALSSRSDRLARSTAKAIRPFATAWRLILRASAYFTTEEESAAVFGLHGPAILSFDRTEFSGFVHDLTVESDHAFVLACGVVAHNCDDCAPLDGTVVDFDDEFDDGDPPKHPACRCAISLEIA